MSGEDTIKKTITMTLNYDTLIKELGESGDKDSTDIHDLSSQALMDKLDRFVDYRYDKKKYGMHQVNLTIHGMPTGFEPADFCELIKDHCDDISSFTSIEGGFSVSLFLDVN
ncbi:hypothetical protein EhV209 [Emiliania huxleyi virus 86]|uniref:Uncharacterized protein n=1 Tax=Emiliania huxleyi virus 86 (isolate United Kingdom/English Channel/1999) TaxID=654925 RepID=Q4A2S4_EHV8U|nr:hypothetical protein EhV209 [Emiliania huxleyi virus 86]AHA54809.1 hypothetical protein EhV145_00258 [Emiliania huxleyi virus 145]AHA55830.1 hypothetical protein EhV164_00242 [Emiliania huxleyi virus 164]CAI65632.1 hypothetical protein EhV209 [Emiliania huxleyi virus 86]